MSRLINYFKDTRAELKHVSWPTRRQAVTFTVIVIVISVATALYLGAFDFVFTRLLERFIV